MSHSSRLTRRTWLGLALAACIASPSRAADKPPAVGDTAPNFTLKTPKKETVELQKLLEQGPVVLVVLRGYPGYQCPACNAQVGQFLGKSREFADAGARVVFVYPGAMQSLAARAQEFLGDRQLPEHATLVLDPDYAFTNAYHLRWNAPKETAYPSTFVIQPDGKIAYALISQSHGGRAKADDVLQALRGR